jgi:hypothetical protein
MSAQVNSMTEKAAHPKRLQVTAGLFRYSAAQFLVALVLLLSACPFLAELENGVFIETTLMTLLLVSAVLAVGGSRRTLALAVLLVLPAAGGRWADHYSPGWEPRWVSPCVAMVFVAFVVVQFLAFILRAPRVNSEVLCTSISTYLLLGLLWTSAYMLASRLAPGSFANLHSAGTNHELGQFDAFYLSFVSLTCLGCNDITPLSMPARMLMLAEAVTGVLYMAILIARLVALYSNDVRSDRTGPPDRT